MLLRDKRSSTCRYIFSVIIIAVMSHNDRASACVQPLPPSASSTQKGQWVRKFVVAMVTVEEMKMLLIMMLFAIDLITSLSLLSLQPANTTRMSHVVIRYTWQGCSQRWLRTTPPALHAPVVRTDFVY